MKTPPPIVELLVNPFCMAHRDVDSIRRVCDERGVASAMIAETPAFCRQHGFSRLEAVVDHRPPPESGFGTSFHPFRKFGFVMDDAREGWEFWPHSRMCYLELAKEGEQQGGGASPPAI